MSEQKGPLAQAISAGGIAAQHAIVQEQGALVGPATGGEFNTIKARLIPLACWRLEDIRFDFDSSFPTPGIAAELENLADLIKQHPPASKSEQSKPPKPGCPLAIFGHADPTGNDDYNKQLSGRRAKAIYALLTRRADLWAELFDKPHGNDRWGRKALKTMLELTLSPPSNVSGERKPVVSPKRARPMIFKEDSVRQAEHDPSARRSLFLAYMDRLCGPELKLQKTDFLGRGEDAGGKADFQGCSEFNPVLVFAREEQQQFAVDTDKTERNGRNAPNRRVMVLIFRAGSQVLPQLWPCPRVSEGTVGCKKRFWSDGEKRRNPQEKQRRFNDAQDTFACRFYQRVSDNSPCERVIAQERWIVRIDKKQSLRPADTVTLQSKAVSYHSTIAVRNAVDVGDFLDFLFVPGPESDYTVSLNVGGSAYFAWRDLHLPGDGEGIEPSKFDYGPEQDHPNPYAGTGRDPNAPKVEINLCS